MKLDRAYFYMRLDGPYRGLLSNDGQPTLVPVAYAYLTRGEVWRMIWEWVRVGVRRDMSKGPIGRRPLARAEGTTTA